MQRLIDEPTLITAIRRRAARDPGHVYENQGGILNCTYRPNRLNQSGCLLGEALINLGVDADILQRLDRSRAVGGTGWRSTAVSRTLEDQLTEEALRSPWAAHVQQLQDEGVSWGDAIQAADAEGRSRGWVLG